MSVAAHPFWVITGTVSTGDDERDTWVVCVALTKERAEEIVAALDAQCEELVRQMIALARWRWSQKPDRDTTEEDRSALIAEHEKRALAIIKNVIKMDRGFFWEDWKPWSAAVKDVARRVPDDRIQRSASARLPSYDVSETSDDPTAPEDSVAADPAAVPAESDPTAP